MSAIALQVTAMERSIGALEGACTACNSWKDAQRERLDRSRIEPTLRSARRFRSGLHDLDGTIDTALAMLAAGR